MNRIALFFSLLFAIFAGCERNQAEVNFGPLYERSLPVISGAALQQIVNKQATDDGPVLVEFGVDFNCERCQAMKPDMLELSQRFKGRAKVVRADFGKNAALVAKYGGTICPTYVLFSGGEPVQVRSHPTSLSLLEADLESQL